MQRAPRSRRAAGSPQPSAQIRDVAFVVAGALLFVGAACVRRMLGVRRRPAWSLAFELTVAAQRGAWAVMKHIGLVRWRRVADALAPAARADRVLLRDGSPALEGAWFEPPAPGPAVLLYLHGGAFAFGSLRTHGRFLHALACATRTRTLAPAYRLAPEHPAPAALEDTLSAYEHLLASGIAADRIVLAGDSAGATLVLEAMIALRDSGRPRPAAGIALSPWVDLSCSGRSFATNSKLDYLAEEQCRLAAASYLNGRDPRCPDVSPLFADLSALPPLLIQVGGAELLLDQVRELAASARRCRVAVRLSVYQDMVHAWQLFGRLAPDTEQASSEMAGFIRERVSDVVGG